MELNNLFLKQKIMRRVLISLAPITLFSIFLFGWRMLVLVAVVTSIGLLAEYLAMRLINGKAAKISEAVLVTCVLYTLTLPPATPWWVAAIGIAFGVFFGKGVFGGFGRNIFNPALVARCFVYVSFPAYLTVGWIEPLTRLPGGFARYSADVVSAATPMIQIKTGEAGPGLLNLFFGLISGSSGETSSLLILLAAVYLIVTKTASWKIMLSCAGTFAVLSTIFHYSGLYAANPLYSLLSGGFLFATVFMTTDPISAPTDGWAKIAYGALIALAAILIRTFSLFTEGIMFAILFANIFSPLLDRQLKAFTARKKVTS